MQNIQTLSKRVTASLVARKQTTTQWETFIGSMLSRLELPPEEVARAEACYNDMARHLAHKLNLSDSDVHVVVQGSMKTQTTIPTKGNQDYDLDIVVKLTGPKFDGLMESQQFFDEFGDALSGIKGAGEPKEKRRCWRLGYPGKPFYFDVTPAIPDINKITGTDLRVRDPQTVWSPSNPEEFADWFCGLASQRFHFQRALKSITAMEQVDPLPTEPVALDDVLRRTVQLIKLHRDSYYWEKTDRKEYAPISVILVTLAGHAYRDLLARDQEFDSAIEVALELVDRLPEYIQYDFGGIRVENPALPTENFADKWNSDEGVRAREFSLWHRQLVSDLEALFAESHDRQTEAQIKNVFGQVGVDSWKAGLSTAKPINNLLETLSATKGANPKSPVPSGKHHTTLA